MSCILIVLEGAHEAGLNNLYPLIALYEYDKVLHIPVNNALYVRP